MLVDSHCHLDFPDFAAELDAVVARARAAGIGRIVTISTRVEKARAGAGDRREISRRLLLGRHPSAQRAGRNRTSTPATLIALSKHPKVVAIGEAGLDYHYDNSPRDLQAKSFREHIAAARETELPLVIHSRDCDADMAQILAEEMGKGAFPAVLHCFTGGRDLAIKAIDLGLYISFTGILTFKNSGELRDIAAELPADRIWSRPTRLISRPCRTAASATSRLMWSKPRACWPRPAAFRRTRSRGRPRRTSSACSTKCRARWPNAA